MNKLILTYFITALILCTCQSKESKVEDYRARSCTNDPLKCTEEKFKRIKNNLHSDYELLKARDEVIDSLSLERIASSSTRAEVSANCSLSFQITAEDQAAGGYIYPLKISDAQGRREAGIFEGNPLNLLGRFQECLSIQMEHFIGQYCTADIKISVPGGSPAHLANLAVCFPTTCSVEDATLLLQETVPRRFRDSVVSKCQKERYITTYGTKEIIALCFCGLFGSLVVLSTLYETVANFLHKRKMSQDGNKKDLDTKKQKSLSHDVLTSFSAVRNLSTILSTEQRSGQIHCLHGMRFFSMCWVVLGHTFSFAENYINNIVPQTEFLINHVGFQIIFGGAYSVDTFFFLSGLLVTYLGMREFSKLKARGKVYSRYLCGVPLSYLLRYLRLTPAYAFVLLCFCSLWPLMGTGPLWSSIYVRNVDLCVKYWWTNLLYINNLYPSSLGDECMGWSWYLANDMQFFLVAPFLLLALYWSKVFGVLVISFILIASTVLTGVFSSLTMQQPAPVSTGYYVLQGLDIYYDRNSSVTLPPPPTPEKDYGDFVTDLYTKPWIRIGAYMVGMLTGYYLYCRRNGTLKTKLNAVSAIIGWILAAANAVAIIFGLYPISVSGDYLSNSVSALYNSCSRPMWCVSLAWVVIACVEGYGGYINDILSWKAFIPLSRLTYCTYLVHPMIIYLFYAGSADAYLNFTLMAAIMVFTATVTLSTLVALFVSISIEIPSSTIVKLIMTKSQSSSPQKPAVEKVDETEKVDYSRENAAAVFEKDL